MPTWGANGMSEVLLARYVDAERRYQDLYECRHTPLRFIIVDQTRGEGLLLAELTEAEAVERLRTWPTIERRWDGPRVPVSFVTEQGRGWLGEASTQGTP